jgi:dipeptidyl aminopeptidase/acylaminoacyl peptidase
MRLSTKLFFCATLIVGLYLTSVATASTANTEKRGMQPSDYFDFVFLSSPQVSPNGQSTVFVKTLVNDDASGRHSSLYVSTNGGKPRAFTQGESDRSPKWSKDGEQLAFLRSVDGNPQLFVMSAFGGEAKQITELDDFLLGFEWLGDSKQFLLQIETSAFDEDASNNQNADEQGDEAPVRAEPDIVVVTHPLYIANGQGYLSDLRSHLFVFDTESKALTRLTEGDDFNVSSPVANARGNKAYFHANMTGDEYEGGDNLDIYEINIETKALKKLTTHQHGQFSASLSANQDKIAYLHTEAPFAQTDLFIMDASGENAKNLSKRFDRDASKAQWGAKGRYLYFTASDHGAVKLFKLDTTNASIKAITPGNKTVSAFDVSADNKSVSLVMESSIELPELYTLNLENNKLTQLSTFNKDLLASLYLSQAEEFWFENDKGMRVQGFVHKPINFDENEVYPLILNIKGGPGGMWGHRWFHENQMYAAKGYVTIYVNYRGSSGYGDAHTSAVQLDYGGADYEDNIQFLDKVLAEHSWIDDKKLFITGGSHGGFLTNWITTKTNRFVAAVTQRSVSSWISEAGTQEFTPKRMNLEFGGSLWENFDYYWDRSPLQFADKVTTPTLIIHSDQDMITPIGQGQEWFYALKNNNVPVEMVIFKGETHSLSRTGTPTNLVERLDRIIEWFERYNL